MSPVNSTTYRKLLAIITILIALAGIGFLIRRARLSRPERMGAGKFPEQIVYVRSDDNIVDAGVIFTPAKDSAKPIAVIWIHGWGVNFYQPTYVAIGRALADRGYPTIVGNTRMHDLGNVLAWRGDKRVRGGGYWGVASEQVRDVAAWLESAENRGFKKVVLVGHSAGWAAVTQYQAEKQDPRVAGVVVASGSVHPGTGPTDPDQIAQATRLMAEGRPEDLVRDPKRSFSPSPARPRCWISSTHLRNLKIFLEHKQRHEARASLLSVVHSSPFSARVAMLGVRQTWNCSKRRSGVSEAVPPRGYHHDPARGPHVRGRRGTGGANDPTMGRQLFAPQIDVWCMTRLLGSCPERASGLDSP